MREKNKNDPWCLLDKNLINLEKYVINGIQSFTLVIDTLLNTGVIVDQIEEQVL